MMMMMMIVNDDDDEEEPVEGRYMHKASIQPPRPGLYSRLRLPNASPNHDNDEYYDEDDNDNDEDGDNEDGDDDDDDDIDENLCFLGFSNALYLVDAFICLFVLPHLKLAFFCIADKAHFEYG